MLEIPRTSANVQFNIDLLNKVGLEFIVQHGTYTTTIIVGENKARYAMNSYSHRVFRCASLIKKDVEQSDLAKEIMESRYLKTNFGVSLDRKAYRAKEILNIDISSAYATCLYRYGLITEQTYKTIRTLPKKERLPCVGMLATSHTKFHYKNGICTALEPFRAKTANVFFFLIDEINYIMQQIQFLLGPRFVFYWVDGVFFDKQTEPDKIAQIEAYLNELGYEYKYDIVEDFRIDIDDKKMMLKMVKNGKPKQYIVGTDNVGEDIKNYINTELKLQKQQPIIIQI